MYQRSADIGLGVPFNIASYALLTHMIAHICKLTVDKFIHVMGDTHVYLNHVVQLEKQLKNTPEKFPELIIKRNVKDIEDFKYDDFELINYNENSRFKDYNFQLDDYKYIILPGVGSFDYGMKNLKGTAYDKIIRDGSKYLPFLKEAKYAGSFYLVRTIMNNSKKDDDRTHQIDNFSNKIVTILSGKWNTAVTLSHKILNILIGKK